MTISQHSRGAERAQRRHAHSRHGTAIVAAIAAGVLASPGVHANAPPGRYTVTSDTVRDTKTQLMWQRVVPAGTYTWQQADAYCATLTLDGPGWRLPSAKELLSVVDRSRRNPAIDVAAFPGAPMGRSWTSSKLAGQAGSAWYVYFDDGGTSPAPLAEPARVRCVR